jgi:flagellar biosynthesis protein FlhF
VLVVLLEEVRVEIGMKIKRFVANDMRQAMRQVREDQGPDAVILSTRRTDEGFEIIAAIDYDESLVREAAAQAGDSGRLDIENARPVIAPASPRSASRPPLPESISRIADNAERFTAAAANTHKNGEPGARDRSRLGQASGIAAMTGATPPEYEGMQRELADLRSMLESQFSGLAWKDFGKRSPMQARMLREFTRMGLDADVAGEIVSRLPIEMTAAQSRYLPMGLLADRLSISEPEPLDKGGMIALIGPTGVGKTTTLAKLAARHVLRNGLKQVALVTTDDFRIGAEEQLFHYGRLLGVPVYAASGAKELAKLLARLCDQRLVLIDTPGLCQGDPRMDALGDALMHGPALVTPLLVLAANAQSGSLDQAAKAYSRFRPAGCVLTKLDEAAVLGGALSVAIRHNLRIDYITDGQRVPEDIARPQAQRLVCRALRMLDHDALVDDSVMAERFGRIAGSLA